MSQRAVCRQPIGVVDGERYRFGPVLILHAKRGRSTSRHDAQTALRNRYRIVIRGLRKRKAGRYRLRGIERIGVVNCNDRVPSRGSLVGPTVQSQQSVAPRGDGASGGKPGAALVSQRNRTVPVDVSSLKIMRAAARGDRHAVLGNLDIITDRRLGEGDHVRKLTRGVDRVGDVNCNLAVDRCSALILIESELYLIRSESAHRTDLARSARKTFVIYGK